MTFLGKPNFECKSTDIRKNTDNTFTHINNIIKAVSKPVVSRIAQI